MAIFTIQPDNGRYPPVYHAACAAVISDNGINTPAVRQTVARAIRFYRKRGQGAALRDELVYIGWPVRIRPNGQYR